jgi:ubiquitin-conjugating enzyme E2 D/E
MATKRLQKEVDKMAKDAPDGCMAGPKGDDLYNWSGSIKGPEGTPYDGGMFELAMEFPSDFPFKAPKVMFKTKIYHCNVQDDGTICLAILKDEWAPKIGVPDIMTALVSLLSEPNPNDALVPEIADLYKSDKKAHDKKAAEFTAKHAM